ncbi:MAG: N-acetylmuramoyl-L-alanine amidase [Bacteroidota bacterium]
MKNVIKTTSILALLLLGGLNGGDTKGYQVKKIVIDAGHGGKDPGTQGRFSQEKTITLQVALKLGKLIQSNMKGVKVVYTRQKDEFVALYQRANLANKNNADVFISIHCNAALNSNRACGTEIFTMGLHTASNNLAVTKRENGVILMEDSYEAHYQGFNPHLPESHILFSLYQNAYNESSLRLAQHIEDRLKRGTGRKSRGVKQAGFLVLWKTTSPSVLVEIGFITHPEEEKYLTKRSGQAQIAAGIFEGLKKYKQDIESYSS